MKHEDFFETRLAQRSRDDNIRIFRRLLSVICDCSKTMSDKAQSCDMMAEELSDSSFHDQCGVKSDDYSEERLEADYMNCLKYLAMQTEFTMATDGFFTDLFRLLRPILDSVHDSASDASQCLGVLKDSAALEKTLEKMNAPAMRDVVALNPGQPFEEKIKKCQERMKNRFKMLNEFRPFVQHYVTVLQKKTELFYPDSSDKTVSVFFSGVKNLLTIHGELFNILDKVKNPTLKEVVQYTKILESYAFKLIGPYSDYASSVALLENSFRSVKKNDLTSFVNAFANCF